MGRIPAARTPISCTGSLKNVPPLRATAGSPMPISAAITSAAIWRGVGLLAMPPSPFGPGDVMAVHLQGDAIEAQVDGDIQHLALLAAAERAVAGNAGRLLGSRLGRGRGNEGDFFARGIDDQDARSLETARGQVD